MTRRRKKQTGKSSRRNRPVVPGQWQTTGESLEDPGAGFMEVIMAALNTPDAPPAFRGHAAQMLLFHKVGAETYSEIVACETTFPVHDDEAAAHLLKATPELCLTQEIPGRLFWQFVGQPPLETPFGDMVFATVELNPGRLYFVTLSQQRSEVIILTLVGRASDTLGVPMTRQSEVEPQYRRMIKQKQ